VSYLPTTATKVSFTYDQISVPLAPSVGATWRERDSNNLIVGQWFWDGTNWLSIAITPRDTLLISGQSITLSNVIVGLVTANTDDVPFSINASYGIYVTKIYAALRIPTGNLSSGNYWTLNLKNGASILQTLSVSAGDDGALTGDVRKSSAAINIVYPKTGKYSFSLAAVGTPPSLRSPSALIEYRLVK